MTLTFIQCLGQLPHKVSIDLNGMWYTVEIWWCDESRTHSISFDKCSRERTILIWFWLEKQQQISVIMYSNIYFKLNMMIEITKLYILMPVLMTLALIQGFSCMKNQKLPCPFSCRFLSRFGWNSLCCHKLLVWWSSCKVCFTGVVFKGENSIYVIL